jgi:hypothetical protein
LVSIIELALNTIKMPNPPESNPSKVPDGDPHIAQDVKGDGNQVIGQAINSTIIAQANIYFPVQKPIGTPHNLPRSGVERKNFVGRDQKLQELHVKLQQNDRIAITAIAGMGGIGKTELALQYAIAQLGQDQYPAGLCWLKARDQEIATQIVSFAKTKLLLTIPDGLEAKEQVDLIWRIWPEGNALIVLDDVTDYEAIAPYLPPSDPRFKVLITTRRNFGASVISINIEELSDVDAIALEVHRGGCSDRVSTVRCSNPLQ